jgi:hypothetical protein
MKVFAILNQGGHNMSDNLATYFHLRVRAVYEDYLAVTKSGRTGRRWDITAATNAAKVLYHLREQFLPPRKEWQDIARQCPDFALLRDVADADKHHRLRDQTRAICNSNQIEERIISTEYGDERGAYRHAEKSVVLKLTNGPERNLLDVLTNVVNYWLDELHSLGLIEAMPHYSLPSRPQPIPREECNHGRMDFHVVKGIDYTQAYQLKRYKYSTGQIEPIDISGADLRFCVYKPRYDLNIVATNNTTGQKITRTVSLDESEYNMVKSLPTDEEKDRYLMTLQQAQAAYQEIVKEVIGAPA